MSTKLLIVGTLGTLCLGVGLAGAETPAPVPEPSGAGSALLPAPLRWGSTLEGPLPPGPSALSADADEKRLEWLTQTLGLTTEQRTAFARILEQRRAQEQALRRQLREGKRKLAEALTAAKPEPATVGALLIAQHTVLRTRETVQDEANHALRALLTAEQRAAFDALPKPGPRGLREPGMGPMARGGDGMARDESPMACDLGAMGCDRRPREPANAMPPAATDPPLPGAEPSRLEEDGP